MIKRHSSAVVALVIIRRISRESSSDMCDRVGAATEGAGLRTVGEGTLVWIIFGECLLLADEGDSRDVGLTAESLSVTMAGVDLDPLPNVSASSMVTTVLE